MPVSATPDERMLDCQLMDAESPAYAIVRQHYLFAGLEQEDFDALAASVVPKQIEKGEILFHRGIRLPVSIFSIPVSWNST